MNSNTFRDAKIRSILLHIALAVSGFSCASGALSDAKVVNGQAGYESMMTYLACRQSGVNLIVHGAGVAEPILGG